MKSDVNGLSKTGLSALLAWSCICACAPALAAEEFPARTIVMVVPFPAGGSTDVLGRLLAKSMSSNLKQTVIVENVGGAGGTIGVSRVAKSAPDGYTVLFHNMAHATAPSLYHNLPYDPQTSFEPIGLVADVPMILVARKNFPANNYRELAAYAKANPGKITFANAGVGATSHLCSVLFNSVTKLNTTLVPYKGTGPALNDIAGGHVDMICDQPASTTGFIKNGVLKGIAVATRERLPTLKDVPTFEESGLSNFELSVWHGLYAPKGTPSPVIDRIKVALQAALQDPELIGKFEGLGAVPVAASRQNPDALGKHLSAEVKRLGDALRAANMPLQ